MMRKLNVVLSAAAALTLSAAPLSAQWGIFGRSSSSDVPAGHMPSRGMCRVWIDGVPPGRQPRQTDCRTAERQRPYYEQRYRRNARVIYGSRSNGRYETRDGVIYDRSRSDVIYGDSRNCRYVERVVMGRVIRQRVCDENGVYDRNGRIYDRNGGIYDRSGVYERNGDRSGVYERNGRVYDRNGNVIYRRDDRRIDRDRDSDSEGGRKNKSKGRGRWGN
jgi:hypothetical protein